MVPDGLLGWSARNGLQSEGIESWAALARTGSGTNWRFVRTIEKLPAALQPLGCGDARPALQTARAFVVGR